MIDIETRGRWGNGAVENCFYNSDERNVSPGGIFLNLSRQFLQHYGVK
jgi:hypothetical protein